MIKKILEDLKSKRKTRAIIYRRSRGVHSQTAIKYGVIKELIESAVCDLEKHEEGKNFISFDYKSDYIKYKIPEGCIFPPVAKKGSFWMYDLHLSYLTKDRVYEEIFFIPARCEGGRGSIWSIDKKDIKRINYEFLDKIKLFSYYN
jgi:hypothetical protein